MGPLLERLGIEVPIVQAGMGGGLSTHELAAAVTGAGGLGTIGHLPPDGLRAEVAAARHMTGGPVAVNLLLPFAGRGHFQAASDADVVVTFWGRPRRRTSKVWIHQCGTVAEALSAREAGADAVIAQGVEAGGHVRSSLPTMDALAALRRALGDEFPVLSAGAVADRADVSARLEAGAQAVVSGTRFLLSDESGAHPAYKSRLLEARRTVLTELFGVGWPGRHRVVPNAATDRWLKADRRGPRWLRALNRATAPVLSRVPEALQARAAKAQQPDRPFFGPRAPTSNGSANLIEAGPLYAGQCVDRINDLRPAADIVRDLTP